MENDRSILIYADPFVNKMFLVIVDAHSKCPEVIQMSFTMSLNTIEALQALVARYMDYQNVQIVSDNGAQFTSQEFSDFVQANGIKHIRSAPYYPCTNGWADRTICANIKKEQDWPSFYCHTAQLHMLPLTSHRANCSCKEKYVHDLISSNQAQRERCLTSRWNKNSNMTNMLNRGCSLLVKQVMVKDIRTNGTLLPCRKHRTTDRTSITKWTLEMARYFVDILTTYAIELILFPTPSHHHNSHDQQDFEDTAAHDDLQDFEVVPEQSTDPPPIPPDEAPSIRRLDSILKEIATVPIDMAGRVYTNMGRKCGTFTILVSACHFY